MRSNIDEETLLKARTIGASLAAGSPALTTAPRSARPLPGLLFRLVRQLVFLLIAATALGAYEHFRLHGEATASVVSLVIAALFGLLPIRALFGALLAIEGRALHMIHGLGGLAFIGLVSGGVVSGAPVLSHGALAPFAVMGAAQALMHAGHPRTTEQEAALRQFVTSLPQLSALSDARALESPAGAQRALSVLTDLINKAEMLGETELASDPEFQSALARTSTHFGLTLGLDAIEQAVGKLAASPAAAAAMPELRERLAAARAAVESSSEARSRPPTAPRRRHTPSPGLTEALPSR